MTSAATADSTGVESHLFLRAQFAVHLGADGSGSATTHDVPPLYGANESAVPGIEIIGTGRPSVRQLHASVCAGAALPPCAHRSDTPPDSPQRIPPPSGK